MFSSYHPISATRPVRPRSAVMRSATMTSAWPRSPSLSARNILCHDGPLDDRDLVEIRHQETERSSGAIRVAHGDADRIWRRQIAARARLPGLALLLELEWLPVDDGSVVQIVGPHVHETGGLGSGGGCLEDPDLVDARERDPRPGSGEDPLDRGDDVRIDVSGVRRLPARAAERAATVHQRAAYSRTLAARGRHRRRVAHPIRARGPPP